MHTPSPDRWAGISRPDLAGNDDEPECLTGTLGALRQWSCIVHTVDVHDPITGVHTCRLQCGSILPEYLPCY